VGLADDNEWGEPGYKMWWKGVYAVKIGSVVTYTWSTPEDTTARILASAIGAYLLTGDAAAAETRMDMNGKWGAGS